MNRLEMQERLSAIQEEAEQIKQALNNEFPTLKDAVPGDKLEDGCIVIEKYPNAALIAAPYNTEIACAWKKVGPVFEMLEKNGFNPAQWFIPSLEQLNLAYGIAKQHFSNNTYWSSNKYCDTSAYSMIFGHGCFCGFYSRNSMTDVFYVRAFRLVHYSYNPHYQGFKHF